MNPTPLRCSNDTCRAVFGDTALYCANCGAARPRPADDTLLGMVLGDRFRVVAHLGQGGSGTLYRAEHLTLGRKVAIKVLHHELAKDELAIERFRREATSVAELKNEHIVEVLDFGRTPDGKLYLAMELLEGETLDKILGRERTLTIDHTLEILAQVAEALREAHAHGYLHRDLRPRNIMVAPRRDNPNFIKLMDFGLAKLLDTDNQAASTSVGMTFGDPHYMAPEQARGERVDVRSDIYQLGCIAYEMLTGSPPFVGNRVFDVLSRHVNEAPVPLPEKCPGVPLWLEAAVARMLAKQPQHRFDSVEQLLRALEHGQATGEIGQAPPPRKKAISRISMAPPVAASVAATPSPAAAGSVPAAPPDSVTPAQVATLEAMTQSAARLHAPSTPPYREGPATSSRHSRPSNPKESFSSTLSNSWFQSTTEGESNAARTLSESETWEPPKRRKSLWLLGGVMVFVVLGGTAIALRDHLPWRKPHKAAATLDASPDLQVMIPVAPNPPVAPARDTPGKATAAPRDVKPGNAPAPGKPVPSVPSPVAKPTAPTNEEPLARLVLDPPPPLEPSPAPPATSQPSAAPPSTPPPAKPPGDVLDPYGATPAPTATTPPTATTSDGNEATEAQAAIVQAEDAIANGDARSAASHFKRATQLQPSNVEAWLGLGKSETMLGDYAAAAKALRKATQLAPKRALAHVLLGEALLTSGQKAAAAEAFKEALLLNPDDDRARTGYEHAAAE